MLMQIDSQDGLGGRTNVSAANPFPVGAYGASAASRIPSSANSVNATVAKAAAGRLSVVNGYNSSASVTYLKFYDDSEAPTVGTDTPVLTLALPATATFEFDLGGFQFDTGIAYGLTTVAADNGTTAVAAGAILGLNVAYI